jgi:hypothetical protein
MKFDCMVESGSRVCSRFATRRSFSIHASTVGGVRSRHVIRDSDDTGVALRPPVHGEKPGKRIVRPTPRRGPHNGDNLFGWLTGQRGPIRFSDATTIA